MRGCAFLTPALLFALLSYKLFAAPAPMLAYLRGTLLAPIGVVLFFFATFHELRGDVLRVLSCASFALVTLAVINQILIVLDSMSALLQPLPIYFDAILFTAMLLLGHIAAGGIGWTLRPFTVLVNALLAASLMALFLKLESHPQVDPFATPALTFWPPIIYAALTIALGPAYRSIRRIS